MISKMFDYIWPFVAVMFCVGRSSVHATISTEEVSSMKKATEPFIMKCIEELGVTDEQVEAVKSKGIEANIDPCFMSCFFKKTGMFTKEGMYDVDKAIELAKPHIKNEDDLAIITNIKKECAKVNDEKVSDGEEGCDRAKLLFECFKEHKDEMDIAQ